jgi:hypothetical protein
MNENQNPTAEQIFQALHSVKAEGGNLVAETTPSPLTGRVWPVQPIPASGPSQETINATTAAVIETRKRQSLHNNLLEELVEKFSEEMVEAIAEQVKDKMLEHFQGRVLSDMVEEIKDSIEDDVVSEVQDSIKDNINVSAMAEEIKIDEDVIAESIAEKIDCTDIERKVAKEIERNGVIDEDSIANNIAESISEKVEEKVAELMEEKVRDVLGLGK